jgi:AAA domain
MKLILLYGLPAVGKLTIAKEIARLTGFKIFHAHLTVDLVTSIFPRGAPAYLQLVWDIRFAVFAAAARANINGLIFTTVYGRDREPFIARCVEVVESFGGEVCFVHLYCHAETLRQRVVREDRKQYGKITSVELLNETLRSREPQVVSHKTHGYCWRTQKCRNLCIPYTFFEGKKAWGICASKGTSRTSK